MLVLHSEKGIPITSYEKNNSQTPTTHSEDATNIQPSITAAPVDTDGTHHAVITVSSSASSVTTDKNVCINIVSLLQRTLNTTVSSRSALLDWYLESCECERTSRLYR